MSVFTKVNENVITFENENVARPINIVLNIHCAMRGDFSKEELEGEFSDYAMYEGAKVVSFDFNDYVVRIVKGEKLEGKGQYYLEMLTDEDGDYMVAGGDEYWINHFEDFLE